MKASAGPDFATTGVVTAEVPAYAKQTVAEDGLRYLMRLSAARAANGESTVRGVYPNTRYAGK